jgi:hypothetical protein
LTRLPSLSLHHQGDKPDSNEINNEVNTLGYKAFRILQGVRALNLLFRINSSILAALASVISPPVTAVVKGRRWPCEAEPYCTPCSALIWRFNPKCRRQDICRSQVGSFYSIKPIEMGNRR